MPLIRPALPTIILGAALLAACADHHATGPEAWWHASIGGKISMERPPPPGDKDPYPNLATVPAKPPAPDVAANNRLTATLIADRIAAAHAAALAPLPAPSPTAAPAANPLLAPAAPAPSKPPAPSPGPAAAEGASGPSAPGTPAAPAPPAGAAADVTNGPRAASAIPPAATKPAASAPLPPLPSREPARPKIAPAPPRITPVSATPPPESPRPPDGAPIEFSARSTALSVDALEQIKIFASTRGTAGIAVTGSGDARASDPLTQSEALDLAFRRAAALATALAAEGVPAAVLRINAEAAGRGASLRLLQ